MFAFQKPIHSSAAVRLGWLLVILLALLVPPRGAQAQLESPRMTASSTTSVTIAWYSVGADATYEYRQALPSNRSPVNVGSVLSTTITGLGHSTYYGFQIRSTLEGVTSGWSNIADGHTKPLAPPNFRATCVAGTFVELKWNAPQQSQVSFSPTSFKYEIKIDSGSWQGKAGSRARKVDQLTLGTTYTFAVRTVLDRSGLDSYSDASTLTVTTAAAQVEPPTGLQTTEVTNTSVKLTWTASTTSSVSYEVSSDGSTWVDSGSDLEHVFSGLDPQTRYSLRARAKSGNSTSCANAAPPVTTLPSAPSAPTGLSTSGISQTAITLGWTKAAGATAYKARKDSSDSWTTLGDVASHTFTGLTANTQYTLEVIASNSGGDSAAATASASTLPNAPGAPTGLSTSSITQTAITLGWTKATGATAYKVQVDNGATMTLGDVATHTFSGLTADTSYTLKVIASNAGGDSSAVSVSASTLPNLPAAPTSLSVDNITQTAARLNWTKSSGATSYEVNGGALSQWTDVSDVATYTFSGLTANTTYNLRVRAVNRAGTSGPAAFSTSTLPNIPATPTGLAASAQTRNGITLGWTKSVGATGYKVQVDSGAATTLGDVATYTFSGLSADTSYTLKVIAFNRAGDSAAATLSASTLPNAPAAPTSLQTSGISQTAITLSWTKSTGATGYKVQANSGTVTTLGDVATHTFTGLTANTAYTLNVIAFNSGGESSAASVSASTLPNAPAAPTSLQTSGISQTAITLSWTKSAGATAYKVQANSGTVTTLGDVATHTFTGLTADTAYTLKVIASNAGGDSAAASVSARTLVNAPATPTGLAALGGTHNSITISWTKSTDATGYKVQVDSGTVATLGDVAIHTFTGLTADTSYTLKVFAFNSGGDSSAASISARTKLTAPPVTLGTVTHNSIVINWTKSTGATAYKVRKDSGDDWTSLGDVATHTFSGLTPNTAYDIEVLASNSHGDSAAGAITGTTTHDLDATATHNANLTATHNANLTATHNANLTATHNANLTATQIALSNSATQTQHAVNLTATANAPLPNAPAAPTGLSTSGISQTAITLEWTKSAGATGYLVTGGALNNWTHAGDVASYEFTGLTAGTQYTLEVRAVNSGGNSSAASVSASTLPNAPAAPTGLSTSGITQTAITLNWSKSTGATAYKVRKDSSDNWTTLGDVATYTFSSLTADTAYTLEVLASNSGGDSAAASVSASTLPNAPAAPTGLTTSGISQSAITLGWTKSTGATGYKVQVDSGAATTLGDVATHTFSGLSANTSYTLKVIASNSGGDSSAASVSANTLATQPSALADPTSVSTSGITQTAITLDWTKETAATSYEVQGGTYNSWHGVGDVATFEFTGLTADTQYSLKVRSKNSQTTSTGVSVSASTLPNAPAAPTGLTTSGISHSAITLNWSKSTGATGYKVQVDSGAMTTLGDVATYEFTGLTFNTQYTLKVIAFNSGGESPAATASASTLNTAPSLGAPAAPTSLTATGITLDKITFGWTKSAGATAYKVRKDSSDSWTELGDVDSHVFTGLATDTAYTLEVVASNDSGDSAAASLATRTLDELPGGTGPLSPPTNLSTSDISSSEITLHWTKTDGATDYHVRGGALSGWTDVDYVESYTFTGLSPSTQYTLEVRAANFQATSISGSIDATTLGGALSAPTGLTTSAITQTSITLNWSKSTGATAYKVRKDSNDSWTTLSDVASYTFSGLTADTAYTLEVLASNTGGDSAAASISASTLPNAPAAPTGLTTSGISQTAITLSWTKSAGATAYKVQVDSGSVTALGDVATYTFSSLSANTAYTLKVIAFNAGGDSAAASVSASTLPNAPAAPTGLAVSGATQTAITLNWTKSAGASSYEVNGGALNAWTDVGDVSSYQFTGLSANTQYTLQVRAKNRGGESATAQGVSKTLPVVPTGLSTSGITQTAITLNWTKSAGASSYEVNGGALSGWTDVGDVAAYTFSGLSADTQYTVQVRAVASTGTTAAASVSSRTLSTQPASMASPADVATSGITKTAITLSWSKSAGATSYEVDGGALSGWTGAGDVASYTFSGLSADTEYTLSVRAKNSQSTSASISVTARTLPEPPDSPSGLQASPSDPNSVEVEWETSDRADSYEIKGAPASEQPGSQAVSISALSSWMDVGNVNSYVVTGLSPNMPYRFEVRAKNPSGRSAPAAIDFQIEEDQQGGQPAANPGQGSPPVADPGQGGVSSGPAQRGDGAESALTATPSPPQFNCTDEQKAMIAISPQPMGLNVQCVGPAGVGDSDLIARGVVLGVDVWGWVRGYFEVCFKQAGDLVFLDAAHAPRQQTSISPYIRDGRYCSQIDRAGALVLLRTRTATVPVATAIPTPTPAPTGDNCRVITTDPLNFRASPGGQYLLTLPALTTLNVHDRWGEWLLVDYRGRHGWVSAYYTVPVEDCG